MKSIAFCSVFTASFPLGDKGGPFGSPSAQRTETGQNLGSAAWCSAHRVVEVVVGMGVEGAFHSLFGGRPGRTGAAGTGRDGAGRARTDWDRQDGSGRTASS